jgi:hypothetical protein
MVMVMRRKTLKIGAITVALVAVAGLAFAYWTGSGTGSGTGTAGSGGTATLTGTVAGGLAPGTARAVSFTAANSSDADIQITTVHLDGITVDAGHAACEVADMTMADVTEEHEVPAGATAEALPVDGSLVYANTGLNQDACKGATLTLTLSSL